MVLVLKSETTARLGEDLDIASGGASLGSGRHACSDGSTEWLLEIGTLVPCILARGARRAYDVDDHARVLGDGDCFGDAWVVGGGGRLNLGQYSSEDCRYVAAPAFGKTHSVGVCTCRRSGIHCD